MYALDSVYMRWASPQPNFGSQLGMSPRVLSLWYTVFAVFSRLCGVLAVRDASIWARKCTKLLVYMGEVTFSTSWATVSCLWSELERHFVLHLQPSHAPKHVRSVCQKKNCAALTFALVVFGLMIACLTVPRQIWSSTFTRKATNAVSENPVMTFIGFLTFSGGGRFVLFPFSPNALAVSRLPCTHLCASLKQT